MIAIRQQRSPISKTSRPAVVAFQRKIQKRFQGHYLLHLPPGYDESPHNWPAIFFLHGSGERGHDPELVRRQGLPKSLNPVRFSVYRYLAAVSR
jgi:predicted peptidase